MRLKELFVLLQVLAHHPASGFADGCMTSEADDGSDLDAIVSVVSTHVVFPRMYFSYAQGFQSHGAVDPLLDLAQHGAVVILPPALPTANVSALRRATHQQSPDASFFVNQCNARGRPMLLVEPYTEQYMLMGQLLWMVPSMLRTRYEYGFVIDVGANIGGLAIPAALEGFDVIAYEPIRMNVASLHASVALNRIGDLVHVIESPVSNKREEVVMDDNDSDGVIVTPTDPRYAAGRRYQTVLIDDSADEFGLLGSVVPFMKIDCEGCELNAMLGAQRLLAAGVVHLIYVEMTPSLLAWHGQTGLAMLQLLDSHGYDVYFADLNNGRPSDPDFAQVMGLENLLPMLVADRSAEAKSALVPPSKFERFVRAVETSAVDQANLICKLRK